MSWRKPKNKFQAVFESSAVGITVLDEKDRIVSWNPFLERLIGRNDLQGTHVRELYPPRAWASIKRANIRKQKYREHFETKILHANGNEIDVDISIGFIFGEKKNITGAVGVIRDISERKAAEKKNEEYAKQLQDFNKELEKRVRKKTRELRKANREIKELLDVRTAFMNQIAHDLRTPLTPIVGLIPIIEEEAKLPHAQEHLKLVASNARYLQRMIEGVLDICRLERGNIADKKACNVHDIANLVIVNMQTILKAERITINNKIPKELPPILADELLISEVIQNLITNAIKYMGGGKRNITLTATKVRKLIRISVEDTGIGIKKDQLKKIFRDFYRVDTSRHDHSAGLGLSICKRIVEAHGGSIEVASPGAGKGSVFSFTVPQCEAKG